MAVKGKGTKESPWVLQTPSGGSEFEAYRDEAADPPPANPIVEVAEPVAAPEPPPEILTLAPMIVGLILGPMAESQFRRALQISLGDPYVFFKHPGSAALLALAAVALVAPLLFRNLRKFRGEDA